MTRINVVPVSELSGKHLGAEYRELPRVFSLVRKAQNRGLTPEKLGAPTEYVLGRGHVLFFYDKCNFLLKRQRELVDEMLRRNYKPKFMASDDLIANLDPKWLGDYEPTEKALQQNRERIRERSNNKTASSS